MLLCTQFVINIYSMNINSLSAIRTLFIAVLFKINSSTICEKYKILEAMYKMLSFRHYFAYCADLLKDYFYHSSGTDCMQFTRSQTIKNGYRHHFKRLKMFRTIQFPYCSRQSTVPGNATQL